MMNKNAACTLGFLSIYLVFAIIALGCGAAAYDFARGPRPGGWYTIILGIIAVVLGLTHTQNYKNDCLRILFIIIGVFAVIVMIVAGIVDGAVAETAKRADVCYAYRGNIFTSNKACCNDYALNPLLGCRVSESSGTNDCLCCYYDEHDKPSKTETYDFTVNGSCSDIKDKLSPLLSATAAFNFLGALWMIIALSISCCRCCGPRDMDMQSATPAASFATGTVVVASPVVAAPVVATAYSS